MMLKKISVAMKAQQNKGERIIMQRYQNYIHPWKFNKKYKRKVQIRPVNFVSYMLNMC